VEGALFCCWYSLTLYRRIRSSQDQIGCSSGIGIARYQSLANYAAVVAELEVDDNVRR
jgi:hypothetical protein